jgi:predicted aspartyl protease
MFAFKNKVAAGVIAVASLLGPGAALADCKLLQMAEFHTDPHARRPVIDGEINGHPIKILIDSGAAFSAISGGAVGALGLPNYDTGERAYGIGGQSEIYKTHINELKIGDFTKKGMDLLVTGDPNQKWGVDMILGSDFLAQVSVEFDLAHDAVRLFRHMGCQPPQLVYWGAAYSQVGLLTWSRDAPKLQAEAQVNGHQVLAEFDSGASFSLIDANAASASGAKPAGLAETSMRGVGAAPQAASAARFDSFALGDEKISHVTMETTRLKEDFAYNETGDITPKHLESSPSMLIGADFFRAHRIFFDTQDHLILFSYAGGPVFETPPAATPTPPAAAPAK